MKQSFLALFVTLGMLITSNHLCFAQTGSSSSSQDKHTEKIKKAVETIGVGGKITVVRPNGSSLYGRVVKIEADGFSVSDVDKQITSDFRYADVKKIYKGEEKKN